MKFNSIFLSRIYLARHEGRVMRRKRIEEILDKLLEKK